MSDPFYAQGLRFSCTQCSRCCRHEPGYVFLTENDVEQLLTALSINRKELFKTYLRVVDINGIKRISLREKDNFDCIFWENTGCVLYQYRPLQCRTYPFWSPFLASRDEWNSLESVCPGVNNGALHSCEEIETHLQARSSSRFLTEKDFADVSVS